MKHTFFTFLAFVTLTSAAGICMENAQAQDFYDRSNNERRRGDYRRGYGDGVDCTTMIAEVVDAICEESYPTSCRDAASYASQRNSAEAFLSAVIQGRYERVGRGTKSLASQALDCREERHGAFDRDMERDSENYHTSRDQERARERERQRNANTNPPRQN